MIRDLLLASAGGKAALFGSSVQSVYSNYYPKTFYQLAAKGGVTIADTGLGYLNISSENSWSKIDSLAGATHRGLFAANNTFVLFSGGSTLISVYQSTDGVTWTSGTISGVTASYECSSLIWDGARYVGSFSSDSKVAYSTNLTSWTVASTLSGVEEIAYLDGVYVAHISSSRLLYRSTDLVNWTLLSGSYDCLGTVGGYFYAASSGKIYTSTDGSTWTMSSGGSVGSGKLWVFLVGSDYVIVNRYLRASYKTPSLTSLTLTQAVLKSGWSGPTSYDQTAVFDGTKVVIGIDGGDAAYSTNGVDYTYYLKDRVPQARRLSGASGQPWSVALVLGNTGGGPNNLMRALCSDGYYYYGVGGTIANSWSNFISSPTTNDLLGAVRHVYSGNGHRIAVGAGGVVISSMNDGASYSLSTTLGGKLNDVSADFSAGLLVAVGDGGKIYTCTAPSYGTWTQRTSGTTENLLRVYCNVGSYKWVAVGANGTICHSSNGTTWTKLTAATDLPAGYEINGVAYANGVFAISYAGAVLLSDQLAGPYASITAGYNVVDLVYNSTSNAFVAGNANGYVWEYK